LKVAVGLNVALKAGLSEFRDRLFLATAFWRKGQIAEFEREMAAAEKIRAGIKIEPFFLTVLGTICARTDRLKEAGQVFESVRAAVGDLLAASGVARSNQGDQAALQRLKGEIELAERKYEEALASFGMVANLREYQVQDGLAFAYFKSGNVDKAIEAYLRYVQKDMLGGEAQESWVLAHYQLGLLFEKKGDAAEAAKWYGRFLELWKDADPDIAEVAEAKRRLAALTPR
jgi:tetratricopeptide (TPR) repeat protein